MSLRWTPIPVQPAAGASSLLPRQLSAAILSQRSWLQWASMCRMVPNSPASAIRFISSQAGSKRRSWPMPRTMPARSQASIIRRALATVQGEGLLAEHLLAGGGGAQQGIFMEAVGNGQDDGLDSRVVQDRLVVGENRQAVGVRGTSRPWREPGRRRRRFRSSALPLRTLVTWLPHQPRPIWAVRNMLGDSLFACPRPWLLPDSPGREGAGYPRRIGGASLERAAGSAPAIRRWPYREPGHACLSGCRLRLRGYRSPPAARPLHVQIGGPSGCRLPPYGVGVVRIEAAGSTPASLGYGRQILRVPSNGNRRRGSIRAEGFQPERAGI